MLAAHLERHLRSWQGPDPLKPLGLATGRTMEPLYRTLVERLLSWSADELEALRARWCSFNLDEYLGLSADDPRGYRAYIRSTTSSRGINFNTCDINSCCP